MVNFALVAVYIFDSVCCEHGFTTSDKPVSFGA